MKDYQELADENAPCLIVRPRADYGLVVLAESKHNPDYKLGHSWGVGCRYDYGFLQLDVESGIKVFVMP